MSIEVKQQPPFSVVGKEAKLCYGVVQAKRRKF